MGSKSVIVIAMTLQPPANVHALMQDTHDVEVSRCQAIKDEVPPHGIFQVTWPDISNVPADAVAAREPRDRVHDTRVIAAGLVR
jgi:hypothetical protein